MPAAEYPFEMTGGVPVVTAPAEIDTTTAGGLRAILLQWRSRGHATVVVDMTGTVFCDMAVLRELVEAHIRAAAGGGGLRLVLPADGAFLRAFTVTGLDAVIPHFATVEQALVQIPAKAARRLRRGRGAAVAPAGLPASVRDRGGAVADSRGCEQCGAAFVPAREHARFCTSACRAAWNRDHLGDPAAEASALTWSMAAMCETTARLAAVQAKDQPRAFAAIGEAVWWITMVDATLVRHHLSAYDTVMAARTPAQRRFISQTLAGLRFARNWISRAAGPGDLIDTGTGTRPVAEWMWMPVPEPGLSWLSPRAQQWERARYRAYQAGLAGRTTGETFGQAVTFLALTGAQAASSVDTSQYTAGSYRGLVRGNRPHNP